MSNKVSFDVDWDSLFPGEEFSIGSVKHNVTPLDLEGISLVTRKIKSILPLLKVEKITFKNFSEPENVVKLSAILSDHAPEIISDVTGIELTSLAKFKPQFVLELITIAIKVNIDSKESLEKNFESLTKALQNLPKEIQVEKAE